MWISSPTVLPQARACARVGRRLECRSHLLVSACHALVRRMFGNRPGLPAPVIFEPFSQGLRPTERGWLLPARQRSLPRAPNGQSTTGMPAGICTIEKEAVLARQGF